MIDISGTTVKFRGRVENSLRRTFSAALSFVAGERDAGEQQRRRVFLSLVRTVLDRGGELPAVAEKAFRDLLDDDLVPGIAEKMVADMISAPLTTAAEAAKNFADLGADERREMVNSLLILAVAGDVPAEGEALITEFAALLGIGAAEIDGMRASVDVSQRRRERILRSGAGVLVALIVIGVFILTATLLRSVIFGLIAAYILLPVEKYFERRLRRKRGLGYWSFLLFGLLRRPLDRMAEGIRRRRGTSAAPEDVKLRENRRIIAQAVVMTCAVALLFFTGLGFAISSFTNHYFENLRGWTNQKITEATAQIEQKRSADEISGKGGEPGVTAVDAVKRADAPAVEEQFVINSSHELIDRAEKYLEQLRLRFENLPLVRTGIDYISRVINDETAQDELIGFILRRTGGIFSFTAGLIGTIGTILTDLLLTIFFFLLFLVKLAEFVGDDGSKSSTRESEYLVRTVFNGNWLPGASPETVREARRIITGVITRLRVWVRGYLCLMLVDGTIYTTMFFFLRVPYFFVLGPLAGCGILLPYIGPVLSAMATILVTLAVGGSSASGLQLFGIILTYLIYNGVIEQFILYPAVIGESLGLSTLETIIVVLLGAIFAGIPGMILALPAASVMKFLVPQIYRCWDERSDYSGGDARKGETA